MKKLLISIALLFPVLSVAAGNPTIDFNQIEKSNEISDKIDNKSFLITYNIVNQYITTNVTPIKDKETCERLVTMLKSEQPRVKKELYGAGFIKTKFDCYTIVYKK